MVEPIPAGWQTKKLWEVTNWDKRFNSVSKEKQKRILSFKHILAEEMKSILVKGGTIKLLATGKFDGYTTQELAKNNINIGEVMTLPSGGTASIKYYDGEFVDSGNLIAQSSDLNEYYLKYIYYYLLFINATVADKYKGTSIKHPYMPEILELIIPFPSISEQKRIVKKLDDAIYKIDCIKAATEENLRDIKDLFESYLKRFFIKEDTTWKKVKLSEITTKIGSGSTPLGGKKSYGDEGISLIRSMNIHDRNFVYDGLAHINEQQAKQLEGVTVKADDVLLNITGASIARCCVVPQNVIPARVNQHVSIIRPKINEIYPKFLCYLLTSDYYKKRLLKDGSEGGSTRQALTKTGLEQFEIYIPSSLDEQVQAVEKINAAHEKIKQLESVYTQKITLLDDLKQSILKQAFAGEL